MAKVLLHLPTSAYAAHIARCKWGTDFELNARQHKQLYLLMVHLPVQPRNALPTSQHDSFSFYVFEQYAKKASDHLLGIGAKIHEYFLQEANDYLEGQFDAGASIKDAVMSYMEKWDLSDDMLDSDTLKKSFYRKRLLVENYPINRHENVTKIIKRRETPESVEVKTLPVVQPFCPLTSTKKIGKEDIKKALLVHFGINECDLEHTRPAGKLAIAKKLYCFLLYCLTNATFRSLERHINLTHRQIYQNVKDVKGNASFEDDLKGINLLLYGKTNEP